MSRQPPQIQTQRLAAPHRGTGREWIVDAFGCDSARLSSLACLRAVCDSVLEELQLCSVGAPLWHQFPPPGGVTGFYLLSESHLACHTYPEHGVATFNLYCCRPQASWPWAARLRERLLASRVEVQAILRGKTPPQDNSRRAGAKRAAAAGKGRSALAQHAATPVHREGQR